MRPSVARSGLFTQVGSDAVDAGRARKHDQGFADRSILRVQEVKTNARPGMDAGKIAIVTRVVVGVLILLVAVSLGALRVEQTEAVGERSPSKAPFRFSSRNYRFLDNTLRKRNVALVCKVLDAAFVRVAGDHAGTCGYGVADRVGVYACVGSAPLDFDDDEVGDVFHVVADALLVESVVSRIADQEVACGAVRHFVHEVMVDAELVIRPLHFNLELR
jgi:hypothetical protein